MKRSEVKSVVLYIVDHYNTEAMEVSDDKRMNELIDECCGVVARQNAKERRKTVRAKRPVQQRKHAICARGGKGTYVACRYWHSIGCSFKGKCPHKRHAVA